jgi:hypothetical protein
VVDGEPLKAFVCEPAVQHDFIRCSKKHRPMGAPLFLLQLSKQLRRQGFKRGDGTIRLCRHRIGKSPRRGLDHFREMIRRQRMTVEPALAQRAAKSNES